jgi:hypothetical protein
MKRMYTGVIVAMLLAVLSAVMSAREPQNNSAPTGQAAGETRKLYDRIVEARKLLEIELSAQRTRSATGQHSPATYRLWFDDAADGENMQMTLRRDGGKWASTYAVVPAWAQSTMQEWRGYHHGNGAGAVWRFGVTHDVDASALTATSGELTGQADCTFLLNRTHDQRFPPGQAVSWWDRFPGVGMQIPRRQTFQLNAKIDDNSRVLEMVLEGGIHWKHKKRKNRPAIRKPIFLRMSLPATRLSTMWVQTPTWNGGFHEGNASGLSFKDGRVSGELIVYIHTDGWVPVRGSRPPQKLVFTIDATLEHNQLRGKYTAEGDMGKYAGSLRGRGGPAVAGSYRSSGNLDSAAGLFHGYVLDDPAPLKKRLLDVSPLPKDDNAARKQIAETLNTLTHEIRALHLAGQKFPLPLAEAMLQTACAEPVLDASDPAALLATLQATAEMLHRYGDARPASEQMLTSADRPESPSTGTIELPAGDDGTCPLPEKDTDAWYHIGQWNVVGPFTQRNGVEHNDALVPDVTCVEGVKLRQRLDRVGAELEDAPAIAWTPIRPGGPRVRTPWAKSGFYNRFRGELWYAASAVRSTRARSAWLALEGLEQTKVWLNDRLVWSSEETSYRCRLRGRTMVPVKLIEGENRLLVRTNRDRRPAWVDLAIHLSKPETPRETPSREPIEPANPDIYPDATPPLAWDVDKGLNVAWKAPDLGGGSRPTVVDGAVLVSSAPGQLARVNPRTGKTTWAIDFGPGHDAAALAKANQNAKTLGLKEFNSLRSIDVTSPISDGKTVYVHNELGQLGAFTLDGKTRWTTTTGLSKVKVHCLPGRVILEGQATTAWELPEALKKLAEASGKKRFHAIGVLVLDDEGKVLHRHTQQGEFSSHASFLLAAADAKGQTVVLHTCTGLLYDVTRGEAQGPFAIDYPGPGDTDWQSGGQTIGSRGGRSFRTCVAGQTAFLATQEQTMAVRLWRADGKLAHAHRWESNYEHSGFGSFTAPSVATDKYLFSVWPVLERGPHCPDARIELHVKDARTGRPLGRLKPALANVVQTPSAPVIAGPYLFTTGPGGGSHGGHPTHSQILVTTADDQLQLIARNLVPMGSQPPVFVGDRMILRSRRGLFCIAVTDAKGKAHQQAVLADTTLGEIGPRPVTGKPTQIQPLEKPLIGPSVPVGKLMDDRATDNWLSAGPFTKGTFDESLIGEIAPIAGSTVSTEGIARKLQIVPREFASVDPPRFAAQYSLQGTGENVPVLSTHVDPRVAGGKDEGTGVLMTVLDNREQNVVVPSLKARGVKQFLAGRLLQPDEPLLLSAGQYPYAVVVTPDYYHVEQQTIYPPINVLKAKEGKLLNTSIWPETWKVLGPLPPESKPLDANALRKIPEKITIGDREFPAYDFKAIDGTVYLTALLSKKQGQKPDHSTAPKTMKIGTSSTAWAMAEIDVPSDGMLYVTAGADWFMRWTLDGEVVYDRLKSGNAAPPTEIKAHPFAIPVTKGKHVLAVQVKPGSRGWSFSATGGFAAKDTDAIKALRVPSRIKPVKPDFRFVPAFKIVPHPMKREARWLRRVAARADRLRAIVDALPADSPQNQAARDILQLLKENSN